ncbi:hypothetical protein MAC_08391 [Metarhizium acridum CQMa 102]|uniref:Uncharacterized protein n=1 Tax=Metarhizium acridum (strain CQMa 102) TaxID=655827 RepID=E9EEU3_METAQ|nr:uncharacterized protein MAC_08391 [Metarhizium acridum CQMa 102]EFY85554.1 hypothetical protein MAC_08391 [Metarhizium acridum CQMa 102]
MSSADPGSSVDKASVRGALLPLIPLIPPKQYPPSPSVTSKISPFLALTNLDQSPDNSNADVSAAVEELLNTLSNKFASVSSEIFAKKAALLETKANESSGSTKS